MKNMLKSMSIVGSLLTLFSGSLNVVNAQEQVVIKVAHNQDFVTIPEAIEGAAEAVNKRYIEEGIDKEIVIEKDLQKIDWNEYYNNINFAHMSGDQPDIYTYSAYPLVENLQSLDELDQTSFVEGAFTQATVDGKVYGFPVSMPVRVIYYNVDALKELGWSKEEIDSLPERAASGEFTYNDFMALVQEVVEEGVSKYGIMHRPGPGPDFLDVYKMLGGEYADENGTIIYDTEAMLRFFSWISDNVHSRNITPSNLTSLAWDTINEMVATGESFAYFGPMFSAVYVAGAGNFTVEEFAEKADFMVFPASEWNDQPFVTAAPDHVALSSASNHHEELMDILEELSTGSYEFLATHSNETYSHSSLKAANEHELVKNNPILSDTTYMTEYAEFLPQSDNNQIFTQELFKQIELLELGETTPENALDDMQIQLEINLDEIIVK